MADELRRANIASVALTAANLHREVMLDQFGITEGNWEDKLDEFPDAHFKYSETTAYVGRAVVALASERFIQTE